MTNRVTQTKKISLEIPFGEMAEVRLIENASAGYLWRAAYDETRAQVTIREPAMVPPGAEMQIGDPVEVAVEIRPLVQGEFVVVLTEARPFEPNIKPARELYLNIKVVTP